MKSLLDGKVAIITGAGRGIGEGVARLFAREGARVALAARTLSAIEATRDAIVAEGGTAICVQTDISKSADCRRLVEETVKAFGRLDCAVNNAAIDPIPALLADGDEDHFDELMSINMKGTWNCMRFEIPAMIAAGGGSIVNVSSSSAVPTVTYMTPYVASKYAVEAMTKTAAFEYGRQGIRVNSITVGMIDTPMLLHYTSQRVGVTDTTGITIDDLVKRFPEAYEPVLGGVALGRFGRVEETAEACAWLCSDRSSYTTGGALVVDGGHSLRGAKMM